MLGHSFQFTVLSVCLMEFLLLLLLLCFVLFFFFLLFSFFVVFFFFFFGGGGGGITLFTKVTACFMMIATFFLCGFDRHS